MLSPLTPAARTAAVSPEIVLHAPGELGACLPRLEAYVARGKEVPLSRHPAWLHVLRDGLRQTPYCLEAVENGTTYGFLPLAYVRSLLFGRFLVSLPYLNYGGPVADNDAVASQLIDRAAALAETLQVRYLELRNERPVEHQALNARLSSKVHMRLPLPESPGQLWDRLNGKVRNQVRKGQKSGLSVVWGREELLDDFYAVFSRNMRDLGTPVFGRGLFHAVLRHFPERAELCVVRAERQPAAAALLLHGWGSTEVPSASSLREFNPACANMLMYWHLLERAVQRGQAVFDFGRSSKDSNTYRFKEQWGARPHQAEWQYCVRKGTAGDLRPDSPRYRRMVRTWQRLPVWLTRLLGPAIVRGIP
jgi:FemAB-related protein (PEP-CTERM system-associated)